MMPAAFSSIYKLCIVVDVIQNLSIKMEIIDNDFCLPEASQTLYGKKPDITRPSANYINLAFHVSALNHFSTIDDNRPWLKSFQMF
jgi:hypothetical protein